MGLFWRSAPGADWLALMPLPGTLLLPALVVLQWRPPGARFVRYLWLWRSDVHESGFRHLRRWLLALPGHAPEQQKNQAGRRGGEIRSGVRCEDQQKIL